MHRRAGGKADRRTAGHSLVEVLVAMLVIVAALLPAGYAVASGIRLGRKGDASARVALALMARTSLLQQAAGATAPRCLVLASGSAGDPGLSEWWTVSGPGGLRVVRLHARAQGTGWLVEDSVELRVRCE
jgi:Tfp pilus assembly protein PilV